MTHQVFAELFNAMGVEVLETHSRKSQAVRTRVAEAFRDRKGVIMFTSDVSARGMDYPDVSLVVQVCSRCTHARMRIYSLFACFEFSVWRVCLASRNTTYFSLFFEMISVMALC